jgi:hypothetical protein
MQPDTVVHAWKNPASAGLAVRTCQFKICGSSGAISNILQELAKITAGGYRAILSAGWYLNYIRCVWL